MIAPAAVANVALLDDKSSSLASIVQAHETIVRILLAHGELVHADNSDRDEFIASVTVLMQRSPDAGKYWEAMLSDGRWSLAPAPTPKSVARVEDIDELREWSETIDIALMEQERAELLSGQANGQLWRDLDSGIEIADWAVSSQTETFGRLRELAEDPTIRPKTDRDELAKARLIPLFKRARYISLLDRWIGKNVCRQYRARRHMATRASKTSPELAWLLQLIDKHANQARVDIFTTYDDELGDSGFPRADIVAAVGDLWTRIRSRGGLRRLQLFLAEDNGHLNGASVRFPHDRHIRCDAAGFALSAGVDRLRRQETGAETWRLHYLWQSQNIDGLREDEGRARLLVDTPEVWE